MVFSNLGPLIAHAKAAMESNYFTLFIYSVDPIDMKNFKQIGHLHIGFTPRKYDYTAVLKNK
jgi:hypothetical protein